ncbi:ABC-type nitrate/sulfonate/bicarbonate transport system, ATpase component [Clostridium aceticum]|uniref:ABC-type nitrate/sulfonate/bicarbonate transport system, ATpase component n=1 Tax=Clostridium aceticum TaxID=84022 RepID=A0A0D8IBR9_9CLOT|nr:ABC transporter ATP-binding protein [Clostridium aceticum]AKL96433.1 ABC-type nitrate/sulfonate/bicarbonate transport system, ATpase component [Clostridium aceticum]KJF27392.1 ABC transporter [Clostridium aceticum]
MAGVRISNLRKQYKIGAQTIHALKDTNLLIPEGSFTTIVGKSGCGKTTLLRLLCGLEEPSGGEIEFTFMNTGNRIGKKPVGIVFQESRLMPWLTVKENMAFPLFKMKNKREIDEIVEKYLHIMGLEKFKNAYPSQISGGMAQRTAVGRTLCYNPEIILMDEPFAALDYFTRKNLQEEMVKLFLSQGKTIIFVTHNVEEAVYLGEKIIVFSEGQVIMEHCVPLSYPRQSNNLDFVNIKEEILDVITGSQTKKLHT